MGGGGRGGLLVAGTVTVVAVAGGVLVVSPVSNIELILEVLTALETEWNLARGAPGDSPSSGRLGLLQGELGLAVLRLTRPPVSLPLLLIVLLPGVGVATGLLRALAVREDRRGVRSSPGSDDILHVEGQLGNQHWHLGGVWHPGGVVQL